MGKETARELARMGAEVILGLPPQDARRGSYRMAGGESGYSSQHLSNSGRPIWTGAVL
jgi:hypothetical protein